MDFVAAVGQLQTKLGCHDAATTVGRIAGDADVHMVRLTRQVDGRYVRSRNRRSGSNGTAAVFEEPSSGGGPASGAQKRANDTIGVASVGVGTRGR
jgi:hypothetical protein